LVSESLDAAARRLLLEQTGAAAGDAWALGYFEALRAEGRPLVGGWPGTVREARTHARVHVVAELARRSLRPASHDEIELAARAAYARARDAWLGCAEREIADGATHMGDATS
jgi:hypothetical protein